MQNGIGPSGQNGPHPQSYGTPDGDYTVIAGARGHRLVRQLTHLTDGTAVIAAGIVTEIREHGPIDAPRATFILANELGQATYAAAGPETLADFSLFLMDGTEVSLHGIARRPFADGPPYVHVTEVEPHFD